MFDQKLMKLVWKNSTFPFSVMSDQNHNGVRSPGVVMGVPIQNFKYVFGLSKVFLRCVASDSSMF